VRPILFLFGGAGWTEGDVLRAPSAIEGILHATAVATHAETALWNALTCDFNGNASICKLTEVELAKEDTSK
jgi:hypothetical protein